MESGCETCWPWPKDIPVLLAYLVAEFLATNCGKFEGTMNVCIQVSEVDKTMEREEFMAFGVSFRSVRMTHKVGVRWRTRTHEIVLTMVLQPNAPINCIESKVRWMSNVEVNDIFAVFETRWIERHGRCEGETNKLPFLYILLYWASNPPWNEE